MRVSYSSSKHNGRCFFGGKYRFLFINRNTKVFLLRKKHPFICVFFCVSFVFLLHTRVFFFLFYNMAPQILCFSLIYRVIILLYVLKNQPLWCVFVHVCLCLVYVCVRVRVLRLVLQGRHAQRVHEPNAQLDDLGVRDRV